MVHIASRQSWGARHRDGDITLTGLARKVVVHHTVTTTLRPDATVAQEQNQMRLIEDIGQNRFRQGISYNVVIFPSGRAYQGVSWNRRGTHTGGHNSTVRSIAFAGNYDTHQPTPQALATAAAIYRHGQGRWWVNGAPVRGHHYFRATACPGRNLRHRLTTIRNGSTAPPPPGGATAAPAVLVQGSSGQRVRNLQNGLARIFPTYNAAPQVVADVGANSIARLRSGTYGPITAAWVREFQRRVGIQATGQVGLITANQLARHGIRNLGW